MKTIKIKLIKPTIYQRNKLDEFINTERYVCNRTNEYIKNGYESNFQDLRNLLVTKDTKLTTSYYKYVNGEIQRLKNLKDEKYKDLIKNEEKELEKEMKNIKSKRNPLTRDWEFNTHKDIRSCAISKTCNAYKSAFSNLRNGNIKFFNMKYKKKSNPKQSIELTKKCISIENGKIKITPSFFKQDKEFNMSIKNQKKYKNFKINHNTDLVRQNGEYFIYILVDIKDTSIPKKSKNLKFCGIDPGVKTLMTVYNDEEIVEYEHNKDFINKMNKKLDTLKSIKNRKEKHVNRRSDIRNGFRKSVYTKIHKRKEDYINSLHWYSINDLLKRYDVLFFGDIKSHDIVKDNKNHILNRQMNDLKLYLFKQRLEYKALVKNKKVVFLNESYTTKTCSSCGNMYNIGLSRTYNCSSCNFQCGRDINSSKNILMKGLITY